MSVFAKPAEAIFAGGCFWFMEADFYQQKGVLATVTGFDGGTTPEPTYDDVAAGRTNYTEAVRIIYNPDQISYRQLLDYFWRHIDPTTKDAQFCERGRQYRAAIFYLNDNQKRIALQSKKELEKNSQKFTLRYCLQQPSMPQRIITRIILRKIRCDTATIATAAAGIAGWKSFGASVNFYHSLTN